MRAISLIAPVAIILVAENLGHIKAIGAMTGRNLDPYLGRAFMGDGIATMLSGSFGGTGMTTYAENMGVMAVTRIYSTLVFIVAAAIAHPARLVAEIRRLHRHHSRSGARRPVDRRLRPHRRDRRADLGGEPASTSRSRAT